MTTKYTPTMEELTERRSKAVEREAHTAQEVEDLERDLADARERLIQRRIYRVELDTEIRMRHEEFDSAVRAFQHSGGTQDYAAGES